MRWGIGIADGERGERGRKVEKGMRNRAESDMLERERERPMARVKQGENGGVRAKERGNKTHGTRLGRKTRTEISRASIRLLFLP